MNKTIFTILGLGLLGVACASGPDEPGPTTTGDTSNGNATGAGGDGTGNGPGAGGNGSGNAPGAGGNSNPGAGGDANPNSGGTANDGAGGGPVGTGGAPAVPEPELVTTGNNAFYMPGTLTEGGTAATVTVSVDQKKQTWVGFGGTFNDKGWQALSTLSEADRAKAIALLFDVSDGLGLTWGRIPIGASDYGYMRHVPDATAPDLSDFSLAEDEKYLIPYIQAAQAVKPDIKFWGSPWTPPPWMKDNNAYDKGTMKSDAATLQLYAEYFVKWVDGYEAKGIPIDHVYPQNEPGWQQDYPSCAWGPAYTGGDQVVSVAPFLGTFVETYLIDALAGKADVWYGTFSNTSTFDAYFGNLGAGGLQKIKGVGLQWGTMGHIPKIQQANANLIIMQSEHKCGNYPWDASGPEYETYAPNQTQSGNAPNDYKYGRETWFLLKQWIDAGVNGYSAWNMVLNASGLSLDEERYWHQNALIVAEGTQLIPTPAYYVFRHVGQYVDPGAKVLGVTGGSALAFENPNGDIVTIVHNEATSAADIVVSVGGKMYSVNVPAQGWATINKKAG